MNVQVCTCVHVYSACTYIIIHEYDMDGMTVYTLTVYT